MGAGKALSESLKQLVSALPQLRESYFQVLGCQARARPAGSTHPGVDADGVGDAGGGARRLALVDVSANLCSEEEVGGVQNRHIQ